MNPKKILNTVDKVSARLYSKFFGERPGLSTFLFHACLQNNQAYKHNLIYPQEQLTIAYLSDFIDYFLNAGYTFINPGQVQDDTLQKDKRYAMLTFDDGYYNNFNTLPVLSSYQVPAVFYIPTAYLTNGKKFWSDTLYTARKQQGNSDENILKEIIQLKSLLLPDIESYVTKAFGSKVLDSSDDISRFMTESEFVKFAAHPQVFIGNHTHNHEILTNLTTTAIQNEFEKSQNILQTLLGEKPKWVSYPNGSYNDVAIKIAAENGMLQGITTIMEKNYFPLQHIHHHQLLLHRFNPVVQNGKLDASNFRSDFQLKTKLKKWLQ